MIQAIKEIGDTLLKRESKTPLSTLIQNPKAEKVITIVFEKTEGGFSFLEVNLEEFDEVKVNRYLYRKGSANGANITPTSKVTELKKTINLKIKGWFDGVDLSNFEINDEGKLFLSNLKTAFISAKEDILSGIANYENEKNSMLTLKIKEKEDEKYIGDYKVFQEYLLQAVNKKDARVTGKNKLCSLCGITKDSVIGKLDTFKFYTLDKPGFISSGFREEDAWKNYPVCNDCKLSLEEGKKFLIDKRKFNFYGLPYSIIPKFIIGGSEVEERVLGLIENITREEQTLSERDKREIERREERILRILSQEEDYLTLNFFFLSREQAGNVERILLLIEDVLPSRLRTIFEKKGEVDKVFGEKFQFNFGRVRRFFQKSDEGKRNNDLDKYFLEIIDRTFKGGNLDFHFVLQVIMNRIRKDFLSSEKEDNFFFDVRDAMLDMLFFEKLGLIKFEEVDMATEAFSSFFEKYGKSFSRPEARGIFLLGSLTELLLRKQYRDREAKPFLKQLQGLKLNEKEIKGLLPKVQNKLEEYKSFDKGKREVAEAASYYLLEAGNNWKLSNDEINFYLTCGMNLANEISNIVYKGGEEDEQQ